MTSRRSQHEEMPDFVAARQVFLQIEERAARVDQAARCQPVEGLIGQRLAQAGEINGNGPATEQVEERRDRVVAGTEDGLEHNPANRQPPDEAEDEEPGGLSHQDQGVGGIGACNEQEDPDVVKSLENALGRSVKTVIQG